MNTPIPQNKIKPILPSTICIQNIYKYSDFLRRRYKQTVNFRFKSSENEPPLAQLPQICLYKVLKHLKVLIKADLSHVKLTRSKTPSIIKQISQTPTISISAICHPSAVSIQRWPKLLPKVRNLKYELLQSVNPGRLTKQIINPLRYLKGCVRLQCLDLNSFCIDQNFSRYPTSLKRLSARPKSPLDHLLEDFQDLESLHLVINRQSDLKKNLCYAFKTSSPPRN